MILQVYKKTGQMEMFDNVEYIEANNSADSFQYSRKDKYGSTSLVNVGLNYVTELYVLNDDGKTIYKMFPVSPKEDQNNETITEE